MKVTKKVNFSLKETINSQSATKVIKNYDKQVLNVKGILTGISEDLDSETGEVKSNEIVILKVEGEGFISSISPTVVRSAQNIVDAYEENGMLEEIPNGINIQVDSDKSSKGRQFFFLQLAD